MDPYFACYDNVEMVNDEDFVALYLMMVVEVVNYQHNVLDLLNLMDLIYDEEDLDSKQKEKF
jgi:hypothetical protein